MVLFHFLLKYQPFVTLNQLSQSGPGLHIYVETIILAKYRQSIKNRFKHFFLENRWNTTGQCPLPLSSPTPFSLTVDSTDSTNTSPYAYLLLYFSLFLETFHFLRNCPGISTATVSCEYLSLSSF